MRNLLIIMFCGLFFGCAYSEKSHEFEQAAHEGILAIRNIVEERNTYKARVSVLEKIKMELENLLAVHVDAENTDIVDRITALKEDLEELFVLDDEGKEDSISSVLKKLALLKSKLRELFPPQGEEDGADVIEMIEKLTELKEGLQLILPRIKVVDDNGDSNSNGEESDSFSSIRDVVKKLTVLRNDLLEIFPEEGDKDLISRIQDRIDGYEESLIEKNRDLKKVKKELRKFKRELKAATKALLEVVAFAEKAEKSKS